MILITGGTGLIGSHLIYNLLLGGNKLRVLIRSKESKVKIEGVFKYYNTNYTENFDIDWCFGDILDINSLSEAFNGIEKVYHCAGYVSFNEKEKKQTFEVNIRGTENIVNQCLLNNVKKLVHVSSVSAIASSTDDEYIREQNGWPVSYKSAYSYSKTQAEFKVWRGIAEGLNAVIVNPTVVLGPGNWNSGSSMLFSRVYAGMRFYTNGTTGFVDVRDVVNSMVLLMDSDIQGERFLLNGKNIAYKYLLQTIGEGFGMKTPDINATKVLTELAWRLEKIRSTLLFSEPRITKISARTSHAINKYSSEKFAKAFNHKFHEVEDTINFTCDSFLQDYALTR